MAKKDSAEKRIEGFIVWAAGILFLAISGIGWYWIQGTNKTISHVENKVISVEKDLVGIKADLNHVKGDVKQLKTQMESVKKSGGRVESKLDGLAEILKDRLPTDLLYYKKSN